MDVGAKLIPYHDTDPIAARAHSPRFTFKAIAVAVVAIAFVTSHRSEAKCLTTDDGDDQRTGPIAVSSPLMPDTAEQRTRVRETRQRIRNILIGLRRTDVAVKAGYAPKSSFTIGDYTYVLQSSRAGDPASDGRRSFDILRPDALIYSKPLSNPSARLIGAQYLSAFSDFEQLDRNIPLNLARWKQTRYRCSSPAMLVSTPWSVDVFAFAASRP